MTQSLSELLGRVHPFIRTMHLIEGTLRQNMPSTVKNIRVYGSQNKVTNLGIIYFPIRGQYEIRTISFKNFRNIKNEMSEEDINDIISGYVDVIKNEMSTITFRSRIKDRDIIIPI